MTPVRVLVAAEQLRRAVPGGIGRYASALLGALTSEVAHPGTEIEVLASRAPRAALRGVVGGPGRSDPLDRWGLPLRLSRLPGPLLTRAWDLGLFGAPEDVDVVHSVSLAGPPVRGARSARRALSAVVTVHDMAWRTVPESTTARGRRWHEAALGRALGRADALVVPSEAVAAELRAAGADPAAVTVLDWGADHLPPPDAPATAALLGRLGVAGPYLMSAGTLEPRKNLRRLIAAYAAARPSLPGPWPLVVVGPRGWGDGAPGTGDRFRVPDGVLLAGPVPDPVLAGLYRGARLFAYVSLAEGYGLPPVEAMGFGVPVVAGDGVPSVAPTSGAEAGTAPAFLVDPRSTGAIAAALSRVASDDPLRAVLSERGRALAGGRTWRRTALGHLELWRSLR